jgi:SAM-dependent methyltransferase
MASSAVPEGSVALYERFGHGYSRQRRPDPRIAAAIENALVDSDTIVNVGAGGGSYEPVDRYVLAVEPSAVMRAERPSELPPAIAGVAEALPLDDAAVDAALAVLTVHHWTEQERGLREMRRVARGPVAVLTFDAEVKRQSWLAADYLHELADLDQEIFPPPEWICEVLGGGRVQAVPIPADCVDGFTEAYYGRPELYLRVEVRRAQSCWGRLAEGIEERAISSLKADLETGAWDERHGHVRELRSYDAGLRLVVSPGTAAGVSDAS